MPTPIVVAAHESPAPLELLQEQLTVLASGADTGSYEVFRQTGADGSGPPPHHHPWDEAFYITAGTVHFGVDAEEMAATAGTFVHVPGGTTHWFRFADDGGEMISITSRPGAAAFFAQVAAEISPTNPDFGALVGIASSHGLTIVPPPA